MRSDIKQCLAALNIGDTCTLKAYKSYMTAGSYRVPPPVYRHLKAFQYTARIFNDQDGVIQILRLK